MMQGFVACKPHWYV